MKPIQWIAIAVLAAGLTGLVFYASDYRWPWTAAGGPLSEENCREFFAVPTPRLDCGWLDLPRDHFDPESPRDIQLPWIRFRAASPNGRAVLVPGGGGPGSSVGFGWVESANDLLTSLKPVLAAGYDIIMIEERGVGWAEPDSTCDEYAPIVEAGWRGELSLRAEILVWAAATGQCRARLRERGFEPAHFSLRQSAHDMVQLMLELDYPQWSVVATSHATVVALALANLEPAGLATLVLDSPINLITEQPTSLDQMARQVSRTLANCQQHDACAQRFPNPQQHFEQALARVRREPLSITLEYWPAQADEPSSMPARIDDLGLHQVLFMNSYWPQDIAGLPLLLEQIERGQVGLLTSAAELTLQMELDSEFGDGLANTVHCGFYLPRQQAWLDAHPEQDDDWSELSRLIWTGYLNSCQRWQTDPSVLSNDELMDTELPTLVLAGGLDPATPADDSALLAQSLSAGQLWLDPLGSHSLAYSSACARRHMVSFLRHHELADCVADSEIDWLLSDDPP